MNRENITQARNTAGTGDAEHRHKSFTSVAEHLCQAYIRVLLRSTHARRLSENGFVGFSRNNEIKDCMHAEYDSQLCRKRVICNSCQKRSRPLRGEDL